VRAYGHLVGAAALLATALTAACGGGSEQAGPMSSGGTTVPAPVTGTVTVMAPAPLKSALDKVKAAYERTRPGTTVTMAYGHVPALLTQISEGVPADILVTPDEATMKLAQAQGAATPGTVALARNELVLVVPAGGTAKVKGLTSLADTSLTVAVCAAELPCGKLTTQLAAKAGVTVAADSQEPGGSPAVVTKAAAAEIDLGVCFATDAKAAGSKVTALPLDRTQGVSATVTAAVLTAPANAQAAEQFQKFLASADGRALFTEAGFAAL
jgi:molybdate transport system substrate-binding protein